MRRLSDKQLEALPVILKLLEISCFLKYAPCGPSGGGWLAAFLEGREGRIRRDLPYGSAEVRDVLPA